MEYLANQQNQNYGQYSYLQVNTQYGVVPERQPSPASTTSYHPSLGSRDSRANLLQHFDQDHDGAEKKQSRSCFRFKGWRAGMAFATACTILVMVCNISSLVYARKKYEKKGGLGTLFEGSCERTNYLDMWFHLAINGLGSAVLVASNYTMQVLTSPTRSDVDRAHLVRKWVDIGIPSVRNLIRIGSSKPIIWFLLAAASIPVHLLYNSVVLSTISAHSYQRITIASGLKEEFLAGRNWTSSKESIEIYRGQIELVQRRANDFEVLEVAECISEYASQLSTDRRHVIIIVDYPNATEPIVDYGDSRPLEGVNLPQQPFDWLCGDMLKRLGGTCDLGKAFRERDSWTIRGKRVEYCLSERVQEQCLLQFSTKIMYAIIAANCVSSICMLFALFRYKIEPLVTIGDAISSFLKMPDMQTVYMSTASRKEIESKASRLKVPPGERQCRPWMGHAERWYGAASYRRWLFLALLSLSALGVTSYFLVQAKDSLVRSGIQFTPRSLWSMGFKKFDSRALITGYVQGSAIVWNAVKANLPQMIVSFIYLNYNGIYTCMLSAREWDSFAISVETLRVSSPEGKNQKDTYFLSLPYRYAIPLMVSSTLIHWLVSQSLFLTRIQIIDYEHVTAGGKKYSNDEVTSVCGYAPLFIVIAMIFAVLMLLCVFFFGLRKYEGRMPLAAGCSAAISAACHGRGDESIRLGAIGWGEIQKIHPQSRQPYFVCGFDSKDQLRSPRRNGWYY